MAAPARPLWAEPSREPENRNVGDAMRLGDKTLDELLAAQEAHLADVQPLVHPAVWAAALEAADGDVRRIAVYGPLEVHVINNPGDLPPWLVREIDE